MAFDRSEPTFRDKFFAEYKAKRPPMPEDLSVQLPYVRRMCEALRLPILEMPGYEADDIIGTLAKQATKKKLDVYLVTSDKDFLQLVSGTVRVLNPTKQDLLIDEAKVVEMLGVPANRVVDIMALMGDTIDNIPGAKGIGEKGAREIIQRFGTVEAALDQADKVENKRYREALQTQREQVLMSKQLATISTDAPVKLDLEQLTIRDPDTEALRALYAELGFTSLLKELAPATEPISESRDYAALDGAAAITRIFGFGAARAGNCGVADDCSERSGRRGLRKSRNRDRAFGEGGHGADDNVASARSGASESNECVACVAG